MPSKKSSHPVTVGLAAATDAASDAAALLAAAGVSDEDAPVAPAATGVPAWAGIPSATPPTAMGDEALRAMGIMSESHAGPGPNALMGSGPNVPEVSLEGIERVGLETQAESKVALASPDLRRYDDDRPSRGPLGIDRLTARLGAKYYLSDKVFDTMKDARGWRLHFTRWYPDQRVIVDFYRKPTVDAASEVEQKIRHLRAHNERSPDAKIGYVPLYDGDVPDTNTLIAACDGHVFDLPLRMPPSRF